MRIVIATLPDLKFPLGRDLQLAKASVLYGDETLVFSPTYVGTEPFFDFSDRPVIHQLVYLAVIARDPGFVVGEQLTAEQRETRISEAIKRSDNLLDTSERWLDLNSKAALSDAQRLERDRIAAKARTHSQGFQERFSENTDLIRRAKALREAAELGLLSIERIHRIPRVYYNLQTLANKVSNALCQADSYGAIDERLVNQLGEISAAKTQKQRCVRVAAELLGRLPRFHTVSFNELVEIKNELDPHLINFRKGLTEISLQIRDEPWNDDFPHEVERELVSRVQPSVAAIEDHVKSNSYLRKFLYTFAKEPLVLPATSALGLVLSNTLHTSEIVSQVVSAVAGTGLLALKAYDEWKDTKRGNEENLFFFYYKASEFLGPPGCTSPAP